MTSFKKTAWYPITMVSAGLIIGVLIVVLLLAGYRNGGDSRRQHEFYLASLNKTAPVKQKSPGKNNLDEPGMAAFHDFLMTFDPATGKVPRERLFAARELTRQLETLKQRDPFQWQGYPSDMGGRTRAIMFDPNDSQHKKVWAGGVTGGLWYNNDITIASSPWVSVGDFWSNLSIRCLAYDPLHPQLFYAGTGEVETAMETYRESSGLGFGIFRSNDGGITWNPIPGTEQFAYITDIVIRVENGQSVIYAGVASGLYKGSQHQSLPSDGLFRSPDDGATWQQVLPVIQGSEVPYCVSDIALGADNRIYVGTRPNLDGEGAAVLLFSDDGTNWTVNTQYQAEILNNPSRNIPGRVMLAPAPSDANVVYALIASGNVNASNGFQYFYCYHILRSADKGLTWTKKNLPGDLTSGNNFATIAWHALDIAVDPNNSNALYIGGLDLHKSVTGGNNWIRVSNWADMYNGGGPDYVHADQHAIVYRPGSSNEIVFGSDGGVFYTANGSTANPTMEEHNKEYSTLQFYSCALYPEPGIMQFYGGLQDNGCLFYLGNNLTINDMVSGGDGAYCFYDKDQPGTSITSLYYNQYYIFVDGNMQNVLSNWSSGTFVSAADLDYKKNYLFCNAVDYIGGHQDQILRLSNLTGSGSGTFLNLNTGVPVFFSALTWSPYSPTGKSTLFVGSQSGRLFRVTEAQSNAPVATEIGSPDFPMANISCIALGNSQDTIMVTFSNYGVASIWQTYNGGSSWQNIEGNLPDMPVRWAIYHPENNKMAMIATETGVWHCVNLSAGNVEWFPVNNGMANVRVDMLQMRASDHTVLAATHGRGMFSTVWDVTTGSPGMEKKVFGLFPNPSQGKIAVSLPSATSTVFSVTVTDALGKAVVRCQITGDAQRGAGRLDLSFLPKGLYWVTLESAGVKTSTEKVILY